VIEPAVMISEGPTLSVDVADLKFPKVGHPEERAAAANPETNEHFVTFWRKPNVNRSSERSSIVIGLLQVPMARRQVLE
jgi:hypothetical protein